MVTKAELADYTTAQIKKMDRIARANGLARKASKASAMIDIRFTKADGSTAFCYTGWHGTGEWGETKTILTFYVANGKSKHDCDALADVGDVTVDYGDYNHYMGESKRVWDEVFKWLEANYKA